MLCAVVQAMFRGGYAGCKTREEFVDEIADVYINKVPLHIIPFFHVSPIICVFSLIFLYYYYYYSLLRH